MLEGCNRLARTLTRHIQDCTARPPVFDFGVIQPNMDLLIDFFPVPIPQSGYMVARCVQWGAVDDVFYKTDHSGTHPHGPSGGNHGSHEVGDGNHNHPGSEGAHEHATLVGPLFRWLMPGDRVLVGWVGVDEDSQTPVVLDIVYPATRVGRST